MAIGSKFGIREICDAYFYKYKNKEINPEADFVIDTAKTSNLESAVTTVYATGGQGNPRLIAWDGEKTLTFTIEDALLSEDSLEALLGTTKTSNGSKTVYSIKSNKFAGTYQIVASGLIRDEDGLDHACVITIHKAKLQSNFTLPMMNSGDPATFTFTFDAFPNDQKEICKIEIDDEEVDSDSNGTATIYTSTGVKKTINAGTVQLPSDDITLSAGDIVTNMGGIAASYDGSNAITVSMATGSIWYII